MSIIVRLNGGQAAAIISAVTTLLAFFVAKVLSYILPLHASKTLLSKGLVELTPLTENPLKNLIRLKGNIRNRSFVFGVLIVQTIIFLPGLLIPDLVPLGLQQVNCDSLEYTKTVRSEISFSNGTILGPSGYLIGQVSQAVLRSKAAGAVHPIHPSMYSNHPDFVVMDAPKENSFTFRFLKSRRLHVGEYEAAFNSTPERSFSKSSFELLNVDDDFPKAFGTIYFRARSFDDINRIVTFPRLQIGNAHEVSRDILLISRFDTDEPVRLVEGMGQTFRGRVEVQEVIVERQGELSVVEGTMGEAIELFGGLDGEDLSTACNMASTAYVLASHAGSRVRGEREILVYKACQDFTTVMWSMVGIACTAVVVALSLIIALHRVTTKVPLMREAGNTSLPVILLLQKDMAWGCAKTSDQDIERTEACLIKGETDGQPLLKIYEQGMDILSRKKRALVDEV